MNRQSLPARLRFREVCGQRRLATLSHGRAQPLVVSLLYGRGGRLSSELFVTEISNFLRHIKEFMGRGRLVVAVESKAWLRDRWVMA